MRHTEAGQNEPSRRGKHERPLARIPRVNVVPHLDCRRRTRTRFSWLERPRVTQEAAGSSPVAPANFQALQCATNDGVCIPCSQLWRNPNPAQRVLAVGKSMHLDNSDTLKGVYVRKLHILPRAGAFRQNSRVNEDDDPIASRDEPLRFAYYFRRTFSRLCKVALHSVEAMLGAATRKLARFRPLYLRIEKLNCCIDVTAVESCIRCPKSRNGLLRLSLIEHIAFLLNSIASSRDQQREKSYEC